MADPRVRELRIAPKAGAGGLPPDEFTLRAIVTGVVLGLVFGAANAYSDSGSD